MKLKITDTVTNLGVTEQVSKVLHINDFDTGAGLTSKITGKGSILAGTGAGALAELPAGTNGQVLTYDDTQATGLKPASSSEQGGVILTNKSGTNTVTGTVIKLYTTTASCFTTTSTESDPAIIGVTAEDIDDNNSGRCLVSGGIGTVLVTGAVAVGDRLASSTTAGRAVANKQNSFATALTANASGNGSVTAILNCVGFPREAICWFDCVTSSVAGTVYHDGGENYGYYYDTTGVSGDGNEFSFNFCIDAGVYTLATLGGTSNDRGKIDYYIDGTLVSSGQDWYGSTAYNVVKTIASITIASKGNHVLKLKVNGRHASSSGYRITLTRVWIH